MTKVQSTMINDSGWSLWIILCNTFATLKPIVPVPQQISEREREREGEREREEWERGKRERERGKEREREGGGRERERKKERGGSKEQDIRRFEETHCIYSEQGRERETSLPQ